MRIVYPRFFFSKKEKKQILIAVREAEKETSGEIRVHLGYKSRGPVYGYAQKVFHKIGMTKTAQRNGVLIFLATRDKKFAVLGDVGINEKVPEGFWNDVVQIMQEHFKQNKFAEGISEAVLHIGEKLKACQTIKELRALSAEYGFEIDEVELYPPNEPQFTEDQLSEKMAKALLRA